jgi:hypothetical protein
MTVKDTSFWLNEKDLTTPIHDEIVLWTFNNWSKIAYELKLDSFTIQFYEEDKRETPELLSKIIEYPIKSYNNFIMGYVDVLVRLGLKNGTFFNKEYSHEDERIFDFAFEIKPEIKSIGEVLRQFQYYKSNLRKRTKLILVTKTKGLKSIFESQGFYVYEYEEDKKDGTNRNKTLD